MEFVTKPLSSYKLDKSPLLAPPLLLSIDYWLEPRTSDVIMCNPQGVEKVASQFAGARVTHYEYKSTRQGATQIAPSRRA